MKTIVVADDSSSIRRFLEVVLKKAGYKVLVAEDGRQALKLALENEIDAVVSDSMMPHLTGNELFGILRTDPEKKTLPMIMISGLTTENGGKPDSSNADIFLEKDANLKEHLLSTIQKLI